MTDKAEETSCIHKTNFDQRPKLAKKKKKSPNCEDSETESI